MIGLFIHMRAGTVRRYLALPACGPAACGLGFADYYLDDPLSIEHGLRRLRRVSSRTSLLGGVALVNLALALIVIAAPNAFAGAVIALVDVLPRG